MQDQVNIEIDHYSLKQINNINFTTREIDVIACLFAGKSSKKIAHILAISNKTVETHVRNIMLRIGCNSRDSILEFIEGSNQFGAIKNHYLDLLIAMNFTKKLKEIALLNLSHTCIFLHYPSLTANLQTELLLTDLNNAGLKIISQVWQPNLQLALSTNGQKIHHIIYFFNDEFIKKINQTNYNLLHEASQFAQSIQPRNSNIIFLFPEQSAHFVEELNQGYPFTTLVLAKEKNYYTFVFSLLQKLLNYNISAYVEAFTNKNTALINERNHCLNESSNNETLYPKLHEKKDLDKYLKPSVVVIGIIIISYLIWLFIFNKPDQPHIKSWPLQLPNYDREHFIGRQLNQRNFGQIFQENLPKISKDQTTKIFVLYGLAGVGKTQLARYYAQSNMATKRYNLRIWFTAEQPAILDTSYIEFARSLGLIKAENLSIEHVKNLVLIWLEQHPGWLIVFDNVANYENIREYLPTRGGSVLITSRQAVWPKSIATFKLPSMQRDEAINLLQAYGVKESIENPNLVEQLGFLPLAIVQAASYMQVNHKSTDEYLSLFKRCQQELLAKDLYFYGIEHEPIAVTWQNNLDAIEQQDSLHTTTNKPAQSLPKDLAKKFLNLMAYLAPEKIPKDVLIHYSRELVLGQDAELVADEIIAKLFAYSLISYEGEQQYNIHRLLQSAIRDQNKKLNLEKANIIAVLDLLVQLFSKNTVTAAAFGNIQRLLPHVDTVLAHAKAYLTDKHIKLQVVRLLNSKAHFYSQNGMAITKSIGKISKLAKQYCEEIANFTLTNAMNAQTIYAKLQAADVTATDKKILPIVYASLLYTYGRVYFYDTAALEIEQAKEYLNLSKEISEVIEQHTGTKIFYKILAQTGALLCFNEMFTPSKALLHTTIETYKALLQTGGIYTNEDGQIISLDNNHFHKMRCLKGLLRNYTLLAGYDLSKQAESELYVKSLLDYLTINKNLFEDTAAFYNTIGFLYLAYSKHELAMPYFTKALKIAGAKNSGQGKLDAILANAYYGLAITNFYQNNFVLAEKHIKSCLQIVKILYRENDRKLIEIQEWQQKIVTKGTLKEK